VAIQGNEMDGRRLTLDRHGANAPRDDGLSAPSSCIAGSITRQRRRRYVNGFCRLPFWVAAQAW
jgi:hypothetical protein